MLLGFGEVGLAVVVLPMRQPLFHSVTQLHTLLLALNALFSFIHILQHISCIFCSFSLACLHLVGTHLLNYIQSSESNTWNTPLSLQSCSAGEV